MDIEEIRPGMLCHTERGSGYVVKVDTQAELVWLQAGDSNQPFQVHVSKLLTDDDAAG